MMIMFSSLIFIFGLISFSLNRKHFLLMLLSLEFIVLSLYLNLYVYFMEIFNEYFFLMVFLTFSVCEGALGLSILVSLIRIYGNDNFQSFNILW
uniref:NADH-ubiquinone oxidoreductase chain 4L n=1 Tax=Anaspidinae sp. GENSP01 TaxID=1205605 RepID=A0A0S2MQ85_9CUCU|nr:NADH deshydrogenase subunit 4L [Anaspidinae sp. GENSP01]